MKRRKNAIYTGHTKRVGAGTDIGNRRLVDAFYFILNDWLRPEDEIEIIPPEQVNPTHSPQEQSFIVADYCVRKILPEITGSFHWGDEVTPRLRALAPIVDRETAKAAAVNGVLAAAKAAAVDGYSAAAAYTAADFVRDAGIRAFPAFAAKAARRALSGVGDAGGQRRLPPAAVDAAECVYYALLACIEAGDEAAYNRIIALTNEMLESL